MAAAQYPGYPSEASQQQQQQQQQQQLQQQQLAQPHQHLQAPFPQPHPIQQPVMLLDRLGPNILRSHRSTVQFKPIPYNQTMDLEAWERKRIVDWGVDEVLGWMIATGKRHGISIEELNVHHFANCTGPALMSMGHQQFLERDQTHGIILFAEFRRLLGENGPLIDEANSDCYYEQNACSSMDVSGFHTTHTSNCADGSGEQGDDTQPNASCLLSKSLENGVKRANGLMIKSQKRASQECEDPAAVLSAQIALAASATPSANNFCSSFSSAFHSPLPQCHSTDLVSSCSSSSSSSSSSTNINNHTGLEPEQGTSAAPCASTLPNWRQQPATKKNKDKNNSASPKDSSGPIRCRKRSQHIRGNKLWEFIRDALKDPSTCPSVVRWEDPVEGVFRIVESEKLARLWGEKKNNQKMTYEKLSRAMRTYYEKKILVPVPKTGLYPKKLVYKFGPSAVGWSSVAAERLATDETNNSLQHRRAGVAHAQKIPQRRTRKGRPVDLSMGRQRATRDKNMELHCGFGEEQPRVEDISPPASGSSTPRRSPYSPNFDEDAGNGLVIDDGCNSEPRGPHGGALNTFCGILSAPITALLPPGSSLPGVKKEEVPATANVSLELGSNTSVILTRNDGQPSVE